ncbi:MAG: RDD family protein [Rickettsiales bacterium]
MNYAAQGNPALFWRRFVAVIVDMIIIHVAFVILAVVVGLAALILGFTDTGSLSSFNDEHENAVAFVMIFIDILYYVVFLSSSKQATLGKQLLGVYVVCASDGGRIGWLRAIARYVICYPLILVIIPAAMFVQLHELSPEQKVFADEIRGKLDKNVLLSDEERKFADSYMLTYEIKFSYEEEESLSAIKLKRESDIGLTKEEKEFLEWTETRSDYPNLSLDDQGRLFQIKMKEKNKQPLTAEEKDFKKNNISLRKSMATKVAGVIIIVIVYTFISILILAFTKEKTAIHDLVCKTRVVRGKP